MNRHVVALVFSAAAIAGAAVAAQPPRPRASAPPAGHDYSRWTATVHRELDGRLAGGYAFEVTHAGRIVASGAYGWARAPWEPTRPSVRWSLDTPIAVASVSKTITATALLRLWDERQHRFSLDAPFWPFLEHVAPDARPEVRRITIKQLLTHHSGIANANDVRSVSELGELLKAPLEFTPGSRFAYHNNNYYILRVVLEQIAREGYTRYVEDHVLHPMGIDDMDTKAHHPLLASGYGKPGDRGPGYPFDWDVTSSAGAAGWYGSVNDLSLFVRGLSERRLLSEEAWRLMATDAFGWDRRQPGLAKGGDFYWKSSDGSGEMHSAIAIYPDDVQAVLLVNCAPPRGATDVLNDAWQSSAVAARNQTDGDR